MIASSRFGAVTPNGNSNGQDMSGPYAPIMVATGPNVTFGTDYAPGSGGTYVTQASPYAPRKPIARLTNGAKAPCGGCNDKSLLSAIPWWGWALMAVGAVAIFRRVT